MTTVAETTAKVQRILIDYLGRVEIDDDGFTFEYGSARVFVRIHAINDDQSTVVAVYAFPLREVPLTDEVYKWIATNADNYRFGHLAVYEKEDKPGVGSICFSHNLLGDFLDPEEVRWVVSAVRTSSDELDDELKAKFGGLRYED
jgi:hypothetical protein